MKKIIIYLLVIIPFSVLGQQIDTIGLPFITNYLPEDYQAHHQTFAVMQGADGVCYFANATGVLTFDGNNWNLLSLNSLITGITISDSNKVYICGRELLGYLSKDTLGGLSFVSIFDNIPEEYQSKCFFRTITEKNGIIYASLMSNGIVVIDNGIVDFIELPTNEKKFIVSSDNTLYIYCDNKLIERNKKGETHSVSFNKNVIDFVEKQDSIYLVTEDNIYKMSSDGPKFHHKLHNNIIGEKIFNAKLYKNDYLLFNTRNNGIFITDFNGMLYSRINIKNGILSDCVYDAYIDSYDNLWLAMDKGLSYVCSGLPLRILDSRFGFDDGIPSFLGVYNNNLFTNISSKLYQVKLRKGGQTEFKELNDNAQMWDGIVIDSVYYMARNPQIYRIDKYGKTKIYGPEDNIYTIKKIPDTKTDYLLGSINCIYHYKYDGDSLRYEKSLQNKELTNSRRLFFQNKNILWISGQSEGVYKVSLSDDISVENTKFYSKENGLPAAVDARFFKWNDKILLSTFQTLFFYDEATDSFKEFNPITSKFDLSDRQLQLLNIDSSGVFWLEYIDNYNTEIYCYKYDTTTADFIETNFIAKKMLNFRIFEMLNYSKEKTIAMTSKGYVFVNNNSNFRGKTFSTYIRSIRSVRNDSLLYGGFSLNNCGGLIHKIKKDSTLVLDFKDNNLKFSYAAPFYINSEQLQYRVKLENFDKNWSMWSSESGCTYNNLSPGDYTFVVEAKNIFNERSQTATIKIHINSPWYRSILAYTFYVIIVLLLLFLFIRFYTSRLRKKNERLEAIVKERTKEISEKNIELQQQKEEIEVQKDVAVKHSKEIESSIKYAYRIQQALTPELVTLEESFAGYFVFYKPRDIVSGDFYWVAQQGTKTIVVASDCTGHGVPGAFMSMLGISFLNQINSTKGDITSSKMLNILRQMIIKSLKQDFNDNNSSKDGMDIALVIFDNENKKIQYSGAYNSLYIISDKEPEAEQLLKPYRILEGEGIDKKLYEVRADRMPIGVFVNKKDSFSDNIIQLKEKDRFYLFSDGFPDMFNINTGDKFTPRRLKKLLLGSSELPIKKQKGKLEDKYNEWSGDEKQIDDIVVIGIEV